MEKPSGINLDASSLPASFTVLEGTILIIEGGK